MSVWKAPTSQTLPGGAVGEEGPAGGAGGTFAHGPTWLCPSRQTAVSVGPRPRGQPDSASDRGPSAPGLGRWPLLAAGLPDWDTISKVPAPPPSVQGTPGHGTPAPRGGGSPPQHLGAAPHPCFPHSISQGPQRRSCLDGSARPGHPDRPTDRRQAHSCPCTTKHCSPVTRRLGPNILKAGDRQLTKVQVRALPRLYGPRGGTALPSSGRPRRPRGAAPGPGPSARLPRPSEGLSPPGALRAGRHPELWGRGCSRGEEIGAGSFLSETETARCFPRSLGPPRRSCSPALRPGDEDDRASRHRGPSEPQCTPSRQRWPQPPAPSPTSATLAGFHSLGAKTGCEIP